MKKSNHSSQVSHRSLTGLVFTTILFVCIMSGYQADARFYFDKTSKTQIEDETDSANSVTTNPEKKVDYLERIYFSHKNKEDLNVAILSAIQSFDGKMTSLSVAKQYAFLAGIKEAADKAKGSCDIEEMLAAGIYNIDADEAVKQGIPRPSSKAGVNAQQALSAINELSSSATQAAYTGWVLSNGSIKGFGAAGKIAGAAGTVNAAAGVLNGAGKVLKIIKDVFHRDKPCDDVPLKDIEIGEHAIPDTNKVAVVVQPQIQAPVISDNIKTITIKNINYTQLQTIGSAIEKVQGVTSVNSDKFESNTATIIINSNLKVKEIINKIFESNKALKFDIANTSATEANLVLK